VVGAEEEFGGVEGRGQSDRDQASGVRVREATEEDSVERAEKRGGCAKSKRQHQHGGDRKPGTSPPASTGETGILYEGVPNGGNPHAGHVLLGMQRVAEPAARRVGAGAVVCGAHREVGFEFLADFVRLWTAPERVPQVHPSTLLTPSVRVAQLRSASFS